MSKTPTIRAVLAADKVNLHRGAPMGSHSFQHTFGRLHLQKVPLDSGGYAPDGVYWGLGDPLYCAFNPESEDGEFPVGKGTRIFVRAQNRVEAKRRVQDVAIPPVYIR